MSYLEKKVSDDKSLSWVIWELKAESIKIKGFTHLQLCVKKLCLFYSNHHGKGFQNRSIWWKIFWSSKAVGYELTGKHARIDCKSMSMSCSYCQWRNPTKKIYLPGLDSKCLNCHEDAHQKIHFPNLALIAIQLKYLFLHSMVQHQKQNTICWENINLLIAKMSSCRNTKWRKKKKFQRFSGIASQIAQIVIRMFIKRIGSKMQWMPYGRIFSKILLEMIDSTILLLDFSWKENINRLIVQKCHNTTPSV